VGKPVSLFFPIIALGVVIVPALCAIKYFLACNNNSGGYLEWKGERRWKAKKLKKKGKTNKQVVKKQNKQQKMFQRYKQGEIVY
jgi:hypothetical protein